jgi:DNA-binding CsgD family transcriptional regulator
MTIKATNPQPICRPEIYGKYYPINDHPVVNPIAAAGNPTNCKEELSLVKIYVIGPNMQQNNLLALCLEKEIKAECNCHKSGSAIAAAAKKGNGQILCLYDCLACNPSDIDTVFDSGTVCSVECLMLVFFNVAPDCRIERLVKHKKIRGVFYQDDSREIFLKGLRAVLNGELWLSRKVLSDCILNPLPADPSAAQTAALLSRREKMILLQVAIGLTNKQIAEKLNISIHTVKTHLYKIFQKIEVPNRLQASLWADTYLNE